MTIEIRSAESPAELAACFPVMRALRPHVTDASELVGRIQTQAAQGYRLIAAWREQTVVGAAGYRMQENLIRGRFCYVDDLVVAESERRNGIGARLLDAVAAEARKVRLQSPDPGHRIGQSVGATVLLPLRDAAVIPALQQAIGLIDGNHSLYFMQSTRLRIAQPDLRR